MGVKIISSNDIMCHVHSHPPSHPIGKIQAFASKKPMFHSRRKIAKRNRFDTSFCPKLLDPVWCHRLSLRSFSSNRMRTPTLAGAPRPRISDTVCLSAVIGPVLLSVKRFLWPYGSVCKSFGRPNFDRESRCNKWPGNEPETNSNFKPQYSKNVKTKSEN